MDTARRDRMDRLSLPCRDGVRLGAELAIDEAAAAAMAAAVRPRPCRRAAPRSSSPRWHSAAAIPQGSARGDSAAAVCVLHQRLCLDGVRHRGDEISSPSARARCSPTPCRSGRCCSPGRCLAYAADLRDVAAPRARHRRRRAAARRRRLCLRRRTSCIGIALALSCAILFALGNVLNREAAADAAARGGRLAGRARLRSDAGARHRCSSTRCRARSRRWASPASST